MKKFKHTNEELEQARQNTVKKKINELDFSESGLKDNSLLEDIVFENECYCGRRKPDNSKFCSDECESIANEVKTYCNLQHSHSKRCLS